MIFVLRWRHAIDPVIAHRLVRLGHLGVADSLHQHGIQVVIVSADAGVDLDVHVSAPDLLRLPGDGRRCSDQRHCSVGWPAGLVCDAAQATTAVPFCLRSARRLQ